jgi:hypothetical protein
MATVRFRLLALGVPVAAAALAGSALAYVCHPGAPGTRTLALAGDVDAVAIRGHRVDLLVRRGSTCSRIAWSTLTGAARTAPGSCVLRQQQVAGATVGVDGRGRPVLRYGGRALPLPAFASGATVQGGLALVTATRPDGGVFAVRLRDGAFTFLGPNGRSFAPRLGPAGAVFHDGESKRALREGKTIVEFVPRSGIARGFARTLAPLAVGGPVQALSMDGLRVALAVGDRSGGCDRVLYWNVAWPPVQRISAPSGPTCLPGVRGTRIGAVAIGGFRAEWLTASPRGTRLIAGSPLCQEWVVRRLDDQQLASVAADGRTIAYATTMRGRASVGIVTGGWRARQIATGTGAPSLAADGTHVAILWPDGTAEVRTLAGRQVARLHVGAARAIALEGTTLATLRGARLDVFDLRTGSRTRSIDAGRRARSLDLQDGVAAFARGRDAVVADTVTGAVAVVVHAPRPLVGVQIEGPGLAYAWSTPRAGVARFVPTVRLLAALG